MLKKGVKSRESTMIALRRRKRYPIAALAGPILSGLGTPFARLALALLEGGDHKNLLNLSVTPDRYEDWGEFRDDYLVSEFLSKSESLSLDVDTEAVALSKFREAEMACSETNLRLSRPTETRDLIPGCSAATLLRRAQRKIARVLGPFSWDLAEQDFGFGPHASTRLRRTHGDAYYKYGVERPHATSNCAVLGLVAIKREPRWFVHLARLTGEFDEYFSSLPDNWASEDFPRVYGELRQKFEELPVPDQVRLLIEIAPGNRVCTVSKNAKTDRCIAVEPDLNGYIQAGIGGLISRRLRRVGIDLHDQSRNQRLARIGSLYGSLGTIDLSSASDTVAMRLVEELLPPDWLLAVKLCRCDRGVMPDGTEVRYQKVSSMGNGFTFELETLIFWCLGSVCEDVLRPAIRCVTSYGDDLIISSEICGYFQDVLEWAGFKVNSKKSYWSSAFRESCGKHYFNGHDVTPFYFREEVDSPLRLIWLANQIRRWARRPYWGLDIRVKPAYDSVVSLLPYPLNKVTVPDGLGDIALIGDLDEAKPSRMKYKDGWTATGYTEECEIWFPDGEAYLIRQLETLAGSGWVFDPVRKVRRKRSDGVPKPKKRPTYRVIHPKVTQWCSYGPWW